MAVQSTKNAAVPGSAAFDLGLGDQLKSQTEDEINARKKKMAQLAGGMGMASTSLLGGMNGQGY